MVDWLGHAPGHRRQRFFLANPYCWITWKKVSMICWSGWFLWITAAEDPAAIAVTTLTRSIFQSAEMAKIDALETIEERFSAKRPERWNNPWNPSRYNNCTTKFRRFSGSSADQFPKTSIHIGCFKYIPLDPAVESIGLYLTEALFLERMTTAIFLTFYFSD